MESYPVSMNVIKRDREAVQTTGMGGATPTIGNPIH
jgi:hypothetical protein